MNVPLILAAVGSATKLISQYQSAQAQIEAYEENAQNTRERAAEMARRARVNLDLQMAIGEKQVGAQAETKLANSASTQASSFSQATQQYSTLVSNIVRVKEQADWDVAMTLKQADSYDQAASDTAAALPWQMASTMFSGGADAYKAAGGT